MAGSAQTHKSFIWVVWSSLYVYLCYKPKEFNKTLTLPKFKIYDLISQILKVTKLELLETFKRKGFTNSLFSFWTGWSGLFLSFFLEFCRRFADDFVVHSYNSWLLTYCRAVGRSENPGCHYYLVGIICPSLVYT